MSELPAQAIATRPAIQLIECLELTGVPIASSGTETVRSLTLAHCQKLAAANSATAAALENHRNWLACQMDCPPECLLSAFQLQADYERSVASLNASELYFGLVEIYLQNELLEFAKSEADRAGRIIGKLQANDLAQTVDPAEDNRQHLIISGQFAGLASQYQQAKSGLEVLLHVSSHPDSPIWTDYQSGEPPPPPSHDEAISLAMSGRCDLAALRSLYICSGTLEPSQIGTLGTGIHPLLGIGLAPRVGLFAQLDQNQTKSARGKLVATQLCSLIEMKEQQIKLEVERALAELWKHQQLVEIKQDLIASLQSSLDRQAALKDVETVDVEARFSLQRQLLQTRSELVRETVARETARTRLQAAIGLPLPSAE